MKASLFFEKDMVDLLHTLQEGDRSKAESALESGLDLNINGEEGITPLLWLIMQKDREATKLALEVGADPDFPALLPGDRSGRWPEQPLATVVREAEDEFAEILLQYGANPNSKSARGEPAIFGAIGVDSWSKLELLLNAGAALDETDSSGANAPLYAAYIHKYDFSYYLVKAGSNPHMPDGIGVTIAGLIDKMYERKQKNSAYQIPEDAVKTKNLLIERGISFPPYSPKEILRRQKEGESIR